MNWIKDCAYDEAQKQRFHAAARSRLLQLAAALRLPSGSYDLRSNKAGPAVSGEITLHQEAVYIQVSQSALGGGMDILIRTCRGRRDYTGGANNWAPLRLLDDVRSFAAMVRRIALGVADRPGGVGEEEGGAALRDG